MYKFDKLWDEYSKNPTMTRQQFQLQVTQIDEKFADIIDKEVDATKKRMNEIKEAIPKDALDVLTKVLSRTFEDETLEVKVKEGTEAFIRAKAEFLLDDCMSKNDESSLAWYVARSFEYDKPLSTYDRAIFASIYYATAYNSLNELVAFLKTDYAKTAVQMAKGQTP